MSSIHGYRFSVNSRNVQSTRRGTVKTDDYNPAQRARWEREDAEQAKKDALEKWEQRKRDGQLTKEELLQLRQQQNNGPLAYKPDPEAPPSSPKIDPDIAEIGKPIEDKSDSRFLFLNSGIVGQGDATEKVSDVVETILTGLGLTKSIMTVGKPLQIFGKKAPPKFSKYKHQTRSGLEFKKSPGKKTRSGKKYDKDEYDIEMDDIPGPSQNRNSYSSSGSEETLFQKPIPKQTELPTLPNLHRRGKHKLTKDAPPQTPVITKQPTSTTSQGTSSVGSSSDDLTLFERAPHTTSRSYNAQRRWNPSNRKLAATAAGAITGGGALGYGLGALINGDVFQRGPDGFKYADRRPEEELVPSGVIPAAPGYPWSDGKKRRRTYPFYRGPFYGQ